MPSRYHASPSTREPAVASSEPWLRPSGVQDATVQRCKAPHPNGLQIPFTLNSLRRDDPAPPRTEMDAWLGVADVAEPRYQILPHPFTNRTVASVKIDGAVATLTFRPERSADDITRCTRTNRIEAIRSDGTLEYEKDCAVVGQEWTSTQEPPMRTRADVARALRPGARLSLAGFLPIGSVPQASVAPRRRSRVTRR
jgi:hypothetical protein